MEQGDTRYSPCQEEPCFLELVRYIHLNPLRAGLVKSLAGLDRYRWSGYAVLMGRYTNEWQDCDSVLVRFGQPKKSARAAYRQYIAEGVEQGRRPALVGGGLIRSLGGWSQVKALRRMGIRAPADERILGSGDFVERIIKESEGHVRRQFPGLAREEQINRVVCEFCDREEINIKELRSGSQRRPVAQARKRLMQILVEEQGVTLAETARQLGVSTSAISKSLMRNAGRKSG